MKSIINIILLTITLSAISVIYAGGIDTGGMPGMPAPPTPTPVFPEAFDVLIAFGIGNMQTFVGEVTTEKTAASKNQVTVKSQCTQEGLVFESNKIDLKIADGTPVTEDERLSVFLTSKTDNDNWVIPPRKITGCKSMTSGKFTYEILTLMNDKQTPENSSYLTNGISLRNNYEYPATNDPESMSLEANQNSFCSKLNYTAENRRAGVQAFRQKLYELELQILTKCNEADRNSQNQDDFETMQSGALQAADSAITADNKLNISYVNYKKVLAQNVIDSNAKIAALTKKIREARNAIAKAEITISAKHTLISTYQSQDKTMDDYKVMAKHLIKQATENIVADKKLISANAKANKVEFTKNYEKAKGVHKKFKETGMKMVQAGRGLKGFYDRACGELKTIVNTKCGKEKLESESFDKIRDTLKEVFCSANPQVTRKLRDMDE